MEVPQTKIRGTEYHSSVYERINEVIDTNNTTVYVVEELMTEFKMNDIHKLLSVLIEDRKKLVHYVDTTVDLYATDRPDLISDSKDLLFKLEYEPF